MNNYEEIVRKYKQKYTELNKQNKERQENNEKVIPST